MCENTLGKFSEDGRDEVGCYPRATRLQGSDESIHKTVLLGLWANIFVPLDLLDLFEERAHDGGGMRQPDFSGVEGAVFQELKQGDASLAQVHDTLRDLKKLAAETAIGRTSALDR